MRTAYALVFLLLSATACASQKIGSVEASTADELVERQAIFDSVNRAVAARDFASLDTMEEQFRTRRSLTPGGTWKLAAYHAGLGLHCDRKLLVGVPTLNPTSSPSGYQNSRTRRQPTS